MASLPQANSPSTQERILASASELFARHGFKGIGTRDIAATAAVNEVTVYRHFHSKRDLYYAVLEAELRKVHLRGDLLARLVEARDGRSVLGRTFELIAATLSSNPNVLRLIQFSTLELGDDVDLLLRKHLGELVGVVAGYLAPWVEKGELRCTNAKALVLTLTIVYLSQKFADRMFNDHPMDMESILAASADVFNARGAQDAVG